MKREYELTELDIKNGIDRFLLDIYSSTSRSEQPKLIIVTAGPGAGKTGVEMFYKRKLKDDGERAAIVNSDRIAMYHPNYEDALEELPGDCYRITRQFVRPASPIIYSELRSKNINIINENTLDKGQSDIDLIKKFKDAGYQILINIMATDMFVSRLSCFRRQVRSLEEGVMTRGIDRELEDKMYNGFVNEVYSLQELGLCDEINVYTRGESINQPKLVYTSTDTKYRDFYDAMITERKRQRNELFRNAGNYLNEIEEMKSSIAINGVSETLIKNSIEQLNLLKQDFISELSKEQLDID